MALGVDTDPPKIFTSSFPEHIKGNVDYYSRRNPEKKHTSHWIFKRGEWYWVPGH
jgi:hypothetical protein